MRSTTTLLFAALASLGFVSAQAHFEETCTTCTQSGPHHITCFECRRVDGSVRPGYTDLDLGGCLSNNDGHLVASSNGGFQYTCTNIRLYTTPQLDNRIHLQADCQNAAATQLFPNAIDLDDAVANINGELRCSS